MLCLPLPPHGHLRLPGHLPPSGAEAGRVTNLVTGVQYIGQTFPQAGEGQLDPQLPLNSSFFHILLGRSEASLPGQFVYLGGGHDVQ